MDQPSASQAKGEAEKAKVEQVFVKTGRRSLGLVEITDGLKPGDIVVSAGQNRLTSGNPVIVDNTVNPSGTAPLTAD